MKKSLLIMLVLLAALANAQQDAKRCEGSEPEYMNRMPGFYISDCKNSEYNDVEFVYWVKGKAQKISKGGKYYHIYYFRNSGETRKFSAAQINQNYFNAVLKIKGKALDEKKTMYSASMNGKEVYIQINTAANSTDERSYNIEVLEVESMQQDVVLNLEESIEKEGKVALYGILFDVGKSVIKPESAEALTQIIDYLTANPTVKIYVVGHTDNTGLFAGNIALSKARAKAVKDYLVTKGKIAATRLGSDGVGSLCPVSTNKTEEGKALNRRVEIVLQ
jgi:OmpA-OmpF porin, OOP family